MLFLAFSHDPGLGGLHNSLMGENCVSCQLTDQKWVCVQNGKGKGTKGAVGKGDEKVSFLWYLVLKFLCLHQADNTLKINNYIAVRCICCFSNLVPFIPLRQIRHISSPFSLLYYSLAFNKKGFCFFIANKRTLHLHQI